MGRALQGLSGALSAVHTNDPGLAHVVSHFLAVAGAGGAIRTLTLFFLYYGIHSLMVEIHQNLMYLSW